AGGGGAQLALAVRDVDARERGLSSVTARGERRALIGSAGVLGGKGAAARAARPEFERVAAVREIAQRLLHARGVRELLGEVAAVGSGDVRAAARGPAGGRRS